MKVKERHLIFILLSIVAAACLAVGCSTPRGSYESGVDTVNQYDLPDSDDVADAMEDLDYAIVLAKQRLGDVDDHGSPYQHDRNAYLIPMSRLAKARLHGRYNQITDQEAECWSAIRDADTYLGAYIHRISAGGDAAQVPFANYSVYFRREKIRRHAFTQLTETYRRAGERDLEMLMNAQIGFSDIYLRSPVAHHEEQYIRTIENSDWVRIYETEIEDIGHGFQTAALVLTMAAAQAGGQMQKANLQQQSSMTNNPSVRASLQQQMMQVDQQLQANMQLAMETMQKMEEAHLVNLEVIETQYQNTVLGALMANFRLLELSDEVKNLPAFQKLEQQRQAFDNYVLNRGFDENAALALADLRSSLDDLTIELQERRRSGGT